MPRLILQMMTTLNGRIDDPDAWVSGVSDDLYAEIDNRYATFDTVLVGRTTYQEMVAYWPSAESDPASSDLVRSMAHRMNTYRKVVISATNQPLPAWNNVTPYHIHTDADLVRCITELKAQSSADVHLSGGASLAQSVVRLGLVDEYRLFVYPVISLGKTWYDQLPAQPKLELLSATPYANGVVGLYYRPQPA